LTLQEANGDTSGAKAREFSDWFWHG
jgi:hypothetical protein